MNDDERFAEVQKVLDELGELSADHVILVEGLKDRKALESVGITGDMFMIQSEGGPMKAAEYVYRHGNRAVILTDWDRRGGTIARELERQLSSLGSEYDSGLRARLSFLCRKYIKDVESLDVLLERLSPETICIKGRK
ncbi:MAG: Toprim subdomain protein [Candidatus Methanoplasma sp.]|jgi:dTMP kinase|nr:Toprim subdomain protein [Candidatus Methanoplasma sp.]